MISRQFTYIIYFIIPITVIAQKEVKTYFDPQRRQMHEDYFVSREDNETLHGSYKSFYPNGNVEMEGKFDDGKRSGIFFEYHENGKLSRKISYVNGLRHGVVEVYDEEGNPVQHARYENNLLVDSIQSYFNTGTKRNESYF